MEKGIPTWWARNLFLGPLLFPLPTRAQPKPPPAAHPSLLHCRAGPPGQEPCAAPFPLTSGPVSSGTASPRHRLCLSGGTAPSASHHANTVFYLGLAADNRNPWIPRAVNGLEFPCLAHINGALPLPSSIISAKPTENIPSPCVTKRMADGEVAAAGDSRLQNRAAL